MLLEKKLLCSTSTSTLTRVTQAKAIQAEVAQEALAKNVKLEGLAGPSKMVEFTFDLGRLTLRSWSRASRPGSSFLSSGPFMCLDIIIHDDDQ